MVSYCMPEHFILIGVRVIFVSPPITPTLDKLDSTDRY